MKAEIRQGDRTNRGQIEIQELAVDECYALNYIVEPNQGF